MQILFSGAGHWVCTSYSGDTRGLCIYDSLPQEEIPSDLKIQIARIYGGIDKKNDGILISRLGVQKQLSTAYCGAFALAFACHAARGDNVEDLNFDQKKSDLRSRTCLLCPHCLPRT